MMGISIMPPRNQYVINAEFLLGLAEAAPTADAYTRTMAAHFARELVTSESFYAADPRRIAAACGRLLIAGYAEARHMDLGPEVVWINVLVDMAETFRYATHAHVT